MAKDGDDFSSLDEEKLAALAARREYRPSAFYRLLQQEGPEGALEAWAAAEAATRAPSPSRKRGGDARASSRGRSPPRAQQAEQLVRRAFAGSWAFVRGSDSARKVLAELEEGASRCFAAAAPSAAPATAATETWRLAWDGDAESFDTVAGEPPAGEIEILGLTPQQRKVAHILARVLGLISESRVLDGLLAEVADEGGDGKVLVLRPPRRRCGPAAWAAPFSVARVFATAA